MANYRVKGWADLGAGGRTEVYAEGSTFQAAKANLEHLYPDVLNVGTAEGDSPSASHHNGGIVDKLFATAFPGTSPAVVFGLVGAGAGYVVADLIVTRLTVNANVATFFGLVTALVCGVLGYVFSRSLLIVSVAILSIAIFAGLFWHLTRDANSGASRISATPTRNEIASCSDWLTSCRGVAAKRNLDPKICEASWATCMKTGHWITPNTGEDRGPATKQ